MVPAARGAALGLVAVLFALIAGAAPSPAGPATVGAAPALASQVSTEAVPCPVKPVREGEVEGQTYECGVVGVPENWANPGGRTIELTYLRLRSASATPAPDPVFYLSGGPGGSALHEISAFQILADTMQELRASRDVVFYDQRGTGYSNLFTCAPVQAALGVVELRRPDLAPAIEAAFDGVIQQALLYGSCAAVYADKGMDLSHYNSVASARDIAAVADALGYTGTYNLYGTSYGTQLAHNALRTTPDRVRSAVLDGVVPPQVDGVADTTTTFVQPYKNIFALCAADAACNVAYPDLDRRFAALLTRLQSEPIVLNPPVRVKPVYRQFFGEEVQSITPRFFVELAKVVNGSKRGGPVGAVPALIDAFERRDTAALAAIVGGSDAEAAPAETVPTGDDAIRPDNQFLAAPIGVLVARAEAAAPEPGPASLSDAWVSLVVGDLGRRLLAGEPQADIIAAFIDWALLPVGGPDRAALTAYADEHLSPKVAAAADALVARMSRQDVRQTMWAIGDVAATLAGGNSERNLAPGVTLVVNCAEDIQFDTIETARRYIDASPYPGLALYTPEEFAALFGLTCTFFPPSALGPSIQDPVVSDTPALLFIEWLDTQTPRAWGLLAAETLRNSFVVEWQSEGHVIAGRSPDGCAGSIAAAFVDDPSRAPDASCSRAAYYTITFVLPS